MASTNKTSTLLLPQWQLSDKPEMNDYNDAFSKIDTAVSAHQADSVTDVDGVHGLKIESGTWTPVVTGVSGIGTFVPTYSFQQGSYMRIGKQVTIQAVVNITSHTGSFNSGLLIAGLPFAVGTDAPQCPTSISGIRGIAFTATQQIVAVIAQTGIRINYLNSGSSETDVGYANISQELYIRASATYLID